VRRRFIEIARGLVRDEDRGVRHDGSRNRNSLFLPTGKLTREVIVTIRNPHAFERIKNTRVAFLSRELVEQEREFDVLDRKSVV